MKGISFVKSHYSILESSVNIKELLAKAKSFNYEYIFLSDSNNLHGALDFIYKTKKEGIKPIVGMEILVVDKVFTGKVHIIPNSNQGFKELQHLSTVINVDKQEIKWKYLFEQYKDFSIVLPNLDSPVSIEQIIENNDQTKAFIQEIKQQFKNVYFGVDVNTGFDYPDFPLTPIIFNQTLFIEKENFIIPDILQSIKKLNTVNIGSTKYENYHLLSPEEIKNMFSTQLILNTHKFFEDISFEHIFEKTTQPEFLSNQDKTTFLKDLCLKGLGQKNNMAILPDDYAQRLKTELDVIKKLNFENYFIIVWDFVKFAKDNGISVGPGRGSAAGSLVSYALNITEVDPIKYNLLFERFLNIDRVSMPDIDLDFEDERREEVIEYVANKYGYDHVAYISTFQTIGSKMAIRDVGRCLNIPIAQINLLTKKVPNKAKISLQEALDLSIAFRKEVNKNAQNQEIIRISQLIEGCPRQLGTHAAGLVLSSKPLAKILPLTISKTQDILQTQYSMHNLEELGLLKMDFLGIKNLTTIKSVIGMVKDNLNINIDINKIVLNDVKTFKMLSSGMTEGIFQLESNGMKEVLKGVAPRSIEELAITISLFRPGPMDNIPSYIKRKHGKEKITYLHPDLEPILKNTQGIIVYQEQIMQISHHIGGFSYSKSDILRRAMSKKDVSAIMQLEEEFISGAKSRGYDAKMAKEIYDLIYEFANYGFNCAHSISYSLIGYQLAYLKAHYPKQFLVSLLTTNIGNEEKLQKYLHEAKKIKINITTPSINYSHKYFIYHHNAIHFPLLSVKGIGSVLVSEIIDIREKENIFSSFADFVIKTSSSKISQGNIEILIKAGAFDEFGHSRISLLNVLPDMIKYANLLPEENKEKLFKLNIIPVPKITEQEDDIEQKLQEEFDALGFYISSHPIEVLKEKIKQKLENFNISNISDITKVNITKTIAIFAMVKSLRTIKTKKNEPMSFLTIEDDTSTMEAVVFPRTFAKLGHKLARNQTYGLRGKFDKENQTFVIEDVKLKEDIL